MNKTNKKKKSPSTGRNNSKKSISFANKLLIVFAVLAILLLAFAITKTLIAKNSPFEVRNMGYDFKVKSNIGVNTDTDIIHLGGAMPGSTLEREMHLTSPQDALVRISFDGPGDLRLSNNDFQLLKNQTENLTFSMVVPDLPLGNYSGVVTFKFYHLN